MRFTFYPQHDQMDCGPSCLRMVARYYGKRHSLRFLKENSYITREGVSLLGIAQAAEAIGFKTASVKMSVDQLRETANFPCVLHWNQNHFVVLRTIVRNRFTGARSYLIADPAHGMVRLDEERFVKSWMHDDEKGIALLLAPTDRFSEIDETEEKETGFKMLRGMLKSYKRELIHLFVGMFVSSLITLVLPFLTQLLIDKGVSSKNLSFVVVILLAQLFLFLGMMVLEVVRNWVLLYLGTRLNVTIISDFLARIFKLPIRFFDSKQMGDFNQRINDHERIEQFLTSHSLVTLFSAVNFIVFFFVLLRYDTRIVVVYTTLTIASVIWSVLFLRRLKHLDYYKFQRRSENQESIYELIQGIQEIKLNEFEQYKRKNWELIQIRLFKINLRILKLEQLQLVGFDFLNQLKNILVTFLAAGLVIKGSLTLGGLLAIAYIIGQLNGPVSQITAFLRSLQDAKLSLDRLNEVHLAKEEEAGQWLDLHNLLYKDTNIVKGIRLHQVSFQYEGPESHHVLKDVSLFLPEGKVTAIVGESGSGKTTLMKLLLKFYEPTSGRITLNEHEFADVSPRQWREQCGVVMQDGYLFSESIERNVVMGSEVIDEQHLANAVKLSNMEAFVNTMPLRLKTKVGLDGNSISGGQRQRILIARVIYKNPRYLFLDEATSALDADNERIIHENLQKFLKNKTAVIIAHRLSTVKQADNIIVLKDGSVVEQGKHEELVANRSYYYELVKNQLELGN